MAVEHIGGAAAHRRSVTPQTNFIHVFWRVVSDRPECFPRGGSKPEVVVGGGSRCDWGVFSTGGWLPEVLPVGSHPRTHQGPHFRSAAATLEHVRIDLAWPGTGRIRRKTPFLIPGTTRNGPRFHGWWDLPPIEDEVGRHHPTALCDLGELPTCFLDGLDLHEASADPPTVFHHGGSKSEVVVGGGSRCDGGVFSTRGDCWGPTGRFPPSHTSRTALPVRCRHAGKRPSLGVLGNVRQPKLFLSFLLWIAVSCFIKVYDTVLHMWF